MTNASVPTPQLSVALPCFSAEPLTDWQFVLDRAQMLDRVGIDRLVVSDHVVMGERLEEYARPEIGGQAGGVQPTGPDGSWLEPLTLLATVAGATTRIRLSTNILQAALRRPAVLAKATATLDVLSRGRLDLGVGVGWQREEYEAAGLDFNKRGELLNETLEVCRTLWTQRQAHFSSEDLRFDGIHMMPKPVQPGGVPIWISGTVNTRVVRRLAKFGSGWIPWGNDARNLESSIARMKDKLSSEGRDNLDQLQIVGSLPHPRRDNGSSDVTAMMDAVPAMHAAGVTDFRSPIPLPDDDDAAGELLTSAVEAFRAVIGQT